MFRYEIQLGTDETLVLPEVGVRYAPPLGRVPLHLTAGGGLSFVAEGDGETEPTLFGSVGPELPLSRAWSVRPEMRVRAVDPWTGTMADFVLSFGWSFAG